MSQKTLFATAVVASCSVFVPLAFGDVANAQRSCYTAGNSVYCSDGFSGYSSGNSFYGNDGFSSYSSGNSVYGNDGFSSYSSGNSVLWQ